MSHTKYLASLLCCSLSCSSFASDVDDDLAAALALSLTGQASQDPSSTIQSPSFCGGEEEGPVDNDILEALRRSVDPRFNEAPICQSASSSSSSSSSAYGAPLARAMRSPMLVPTRPQEWTWGEQVVDAAAPVPQNKDSSFCCLEDLEEHNDTPITSPRYASWSSPTRHAHDDLTWVDEGFFMPNDSRVDLLHTTPVLGNFHLGDMSSRATSSSSSSSSSSSTLPPVSSAPELTTPTPAPFALTTPPTSGSDSDHDAYKWQQSDWTDESDWPDYDPAAYETSVPVDLSTSSPLPPVSSAPTIASEQPVEIVTPTPQDAAQDAS